MSPVFDVILFIIIACACAFTTGKIENQKRWNSMASSSSWFKMLTNAFIAGLEHRKPCRKPVFNVGIPDGNFSVKDLRTAAQKVVEGCSFGVYGGTWC